MNRLFFIDECPSTNDCIEDYIDALNPAFTGLCTFNQTKGKGQYGNRWQEVKDENIAITFALPAKEMTLADSLFNYYTAILLRDFIANLTKAEVKTKWPNDLIINNKKVSGILIEKKKFGNESYLIVGIGINMLTQNFDGISNAGSLFTATGQKFDLQLLSEQLFKYFEENYRNTFAEEELLERYNKHLYRRDAVSCFSLNDERQNGIIKHADDQGYLWVDLEKDGLSKFFHKEITLLY